MTTATMPVIALAGSPNAGKSVLFNALTGLNQKVGNYPGVTVERKTGTSKPWNGKTYQFIDLPGTYSLDPISLDEQVAIDVLLGRGTVRGETRPDLVVAVIDAANLERTLGLVLELRETGLPIVVAMNMMDIAKRRGLKLNVRKLQSLIGAPVVPMVATRGDGMPALMTEIEKQIEKHNRQASTWKIPSPDQIQKRYHDIDQILAEAVESPTQADRLTWKIDRIVLHPVVGLVILTIVLLTMFQAVFTWAKPLADGIDAGVGATGKYLQTVLPDMWLRDLLTDGVISGVGSVLVFLPQIVILFFFINLLEASGYMTRAAFMLDRMMFSCGLQGRSFVPLLSSFACAIPGVMATRTIRNDRDRLVTILVAPLMTCSARLPVYTLLVSAFVPATLVFGGIDARALTMFGLFAVGVVSAFIVAWISRIFGGKRSQSLFLLEMPSYRMPQWKYIFTSIWLRTKAFLYRAGTIILTSSILIWLLSSFPKPPAGATGPAIDYSIAGRLGHLIEPVVKPIGFDWRIATGLIPGMAAREVMVSSLATVFAVEAGDNEERQAESLREKIIAAWPPATGFALIAWYIYAPQCMSTIATVRRETGGWKWALVMTSYMFALAWFAAWVTYQWFAAI